MKRMGKLFLSLLLLSAALFSPLGGAVHAQQEEEKNYQLQAGDTSYTIFFEGITVCGKCLETQPPLGASEVDQRVCTSQELLEQKRFIPCTFCHLFVLVNEVVNFVLFDIIPLVAVLLIILGGYYFFLSAGDPSRVEKGKKILMALAGGVFLMYGSWLIVSVLLSGIGVSEWTGLGSWFEIQCDIGEDFFDRGEGE